MSNKKWNIVHCPEDMDYFENEIDNKIFIQSLSIVRRILNFNDIGGIVYQFDFLSPLCIVFLTSL